MTGQHFNGGNHSKFLVHLMLSISPIYPIYPVCVCFLALGDLLLMLLRVSLSSPTKCQWCSTLTTCTRSPPSSPTAMNTSLRARRHHTCPRRFWTQRRVRPLPPGLFSLWAFRQTLRPVCVHPQVFPGLLTHRSSLPTTPCLLGRWDPLLTPWAGSCRSKFYSHTHTHTSHTLFIIQSKVSGSQVCMRHQEQRKILEEFVSVYAFMVIGAAPQVSAFVLVFAAWRV